MWRNKTNLISETSTTESVKKIRTETCLLRLIEEEDEEEELMYLMFVCFQVQHLQTNPDVGPRLLLLQVSHTHTNSLLFQLVNIIFGFIDTLTLLS